MHIRKRIHIAVVCVSKMALVAVAGYHIGHLVDLVSPLPLFLSLSVSPGPRSLRPPELTHHRTPPLPRLLLATKEVSAVANVVPQRSSHREKRDRRDLDSIYLAILRKANEESFLGQDRHGKSGFRGCIGKRRRAGVE